MEAFALLKHPPRGLVVAALFNWLNLPKPLAEAPDVDSVLGAKMCASWVTLNTVGTSIEVVTADRRLQSQ